MDPGPSAHDKEALHWVPKEAIDVTHAFLDRLFPRIPIHPFMMLLLQLNQVWHKHEAACIKDLRQRHKAGQHGRMHSEVVLATSASTQGEMRSVRELSTSSATLETLV